ncbi:MAG: hypothetical protein IT361_02430 [Gemmatimonadaceae bacterium]|nr:hypothetical protein [Gemmatimonadaceae bacterium]
MIAPPDPPRDPGARRRAAQGRQHLRAFRVLVQELARLVAQLEDARAESSTQLLTPQVAETLRQVAARRPLPTDTIWRGGSDPAALHLAALADAGLIELVSRDAEVDTPQVRLTTTGEFQLMLMDQPGLVRMARASSDLTTEQLRVTHETLRSLRQAIDRGGPTPAAPWASTNRRPPQHVLPEAAGG